MFVLTKADKIYMIKEAIKIVRIEHPSDNKGLFRSESIDGNSLLRQHSQFDIICERHSNRKVFPTYLGDSYLNEQLDEETLQEYKFAFKSIDQLQVALTAEELREAINDLGFRVLMLTVNNYFESPYQVVFKDPLTTEDISGLFS